jgi:hypothetical protein
MRLTPLLATIAVTGALAGGGAAIASAATSTSTTTPTTTRPTSPKPAPANRPPAGRGPGGSHHCHNMRAVARPPAEWAAGLRAPQPRPGTPLALALLARQPDS